MQNILLAGATGYLGKHVLMELQKQHYPVKIVVRNKNKGSHNSKRTVTVIAETTKPESLIGIMDGVETVISTMGITKQKDGFKYMDVDYKANLNLLQEAKRSGVKRFLYVSAFNADKLTHLKMCYAKERFVEELERSGLDYCIIRPNGFFSDMTEFLDMAKKGKADLFGDGSFKMNPIHGKDLAEICVDAIGSTEKHIEVGGPEVFTHKEMAHLAFNVLDKEPKIRYIPEWMRKMILWSARTFSSSKTYGPMEFFFTVLSMNMIAPAYGRHTLLEYFKEMKQQMLEKP